MNDVPALSLEVLRLIDPAPQALGLARGKRLDGVEDRVFQTPPVPELENHATGFVALATLKTRGDELLERTHPERHRRVGERVLVESPTDWKPRADFSESIMQPLAAAIGVNAVVYVGKTTTGTLVFEVLEAGW